LTKNVLIYYTELKILRKVRTKIKNVIIKIGLILFFLLARPRNSSAIDFPQSSINTKVEVFLYQKIKIAEIVKQYQECEKKN